MKSPKKWLQAMAGIGVSVALLWWLLRDVHPGEVKAALLAADWRIFLLAPASWFTTWLLRSVRWRFLLEPPTPPYRLRWDANAIGFFALMVLPLRIGEVLRAAVLSREEPRPFAACAASIVLERIFDMIAVLLLLGGALLTLDPARASVVNPTLLKAMKTMGALLAVGVLALPVVVRFGPAFARRFGRLGGHAATFLEAVGAVRGLRLAGTLATTVVIWIANVAAFYYAARAFSVHPGVSIGDEIGWAGSAFMLGATCLAIAAPSSPGFFGTFHAGAAAGLAVYGFGKNEIIPFVLATHMANFLMTLALGGEAILHRGWKLDMGETVE